MEPPSVAPPPIAYDADRLFRQDRSTIGNIVRATFAAWSDRAIAAAFLLAALATAHAWCAERPWVIAAWAALAAGSAAGIAAERWIAARLAFHASDGLLAANALHPPIRRRYRIGWLGVGLVSLVGLTLIARPSLLLVGIPAYLAGALGARLTGGIAVPRRFTGLARPGWTLRFWSRHPVAGVAFAVAFLLVLIPARTLGTDAQLAAVGIGTLAIASLLSGVDDAVVRFMTLAGHGSGRIVLWHVRSVASLIAVAGAECWMILGPIAAAIVGAVGSAMVMLLGLRILAYRLHGKRFADVMVSILAGVLMLTAYSLPVALPVVALAILLQLHVRARSRTWLLA